MQNLEHDMDELFRRAVEKVPLLPGNSRWDEIAGKLSGSLSVSTAKQKETNNKRIIGMLGFFLLGVISSTFLTTFIKYKDSNLPGNQFDKTSVIYNRRTVDSKDHTSNTILLNTIKPSHFLFNPALLQTISLQKCTRISILIIVSVLQKD